MECSASSCPTDATRRVTRRHSWTSDHPVSRALFELPRHADHHAHAGRPFGFFVTSQTPPNCHWLRWHGAACARSAIYFRVMDEAIDRDCSPRGLNLMPKIIDHDARRRQVFEGSLDLFSTTGTRGWGCDSSPARSVCRQDRLYHYFPNKSSLLRGCFDTWRRVMSLRPSAPWASSRTLRSACQWSVSLSSRRPTVFALYSGSPSTTVEPWAMQGSPWSEVFGVYESGIAEHLTGGDRDKAAKC